MKKIDEIVEIIKNEELEDILNIGWIDRDEEMFFYEWRKEDRCDQK